MALVTWARGGRVGLRGVRLVAAWFALAAASGAGAVVVAGVGAGPSGEGGPRATGPDGAGGGKAPAKDGASETGKGGGKDGGKSTPAPLVAFPAPLITEVLFAVPTGSEGDANRDGVRQVSGDEFVELVNPHPKAIDLKGWTLSDKRASEKTKSGAPASGAVRFTFPPCMLKPGQAVVVFNGYGCTWGEEVGDAKAAPPRASAEFGGAVVFSMKNVQERSSFSNSADWVLLSDPQGRPVQLVRWGSVEGKVEGVTLEEVAPPVMGSSVQRSGLRGALEPHRESENGRFSPGLFDNPLFDGFRKLSKPGAGVPGGKPPTEKVPAEKPKPEEPSPTPGEPAGPEPADAPEPR